jgi:aldose 1-epimerase
LAELRGKPARAATVAASFHVNPLRRIFLRDGALTVGIAPDCGGALTMFEIRVRDTVVELLRPADDQPAHAVWALGSSSFPLVPYGGRLRTGSFQFEGRQYRYPLNAPPERHSSHGDGWTGCWTLTQLNRRTATMVFEAETPAPMRYRCTQTVALAGGRLRITLSASNLESHRIPFGFGLHPYFGNRALASVRAYLPARWRWDQELMPVAMETNPDAASLLRGRPVSELPVATEYADWDGRATIEWPTLRVRIKLSTSPPLRHVVMWIPEGESFFCFEPISHATDALNRQAGHPPHEDFVVLEPDATFDQSFDFLVSSG